MSGRDGFRTTHQPGPIVKHAYNLTVTTNASGDATWTFPAPFPNALLNFQLTEVTAPGVLGSVVVKGLPAFSDETGVSFRAYASTTGAVIASFPVTVNITAWGI